MEFDVDSPLPQEDSLRQALQDYAVVTLDSNGKIVKWSDGAEGTFGWQASEVVGHSFDLLFTPEDRAANKPEMELSRAAQGEASEDERWHLRKDGTRIWVSGIVRALRNNSGELTGFSKVARDITAQKLAELQREAVLEREQRGREWAEKRWRYLQDIFENLPAIVGLVRLPEQVYVFANRTFRDSVRDRPLIGQSIRDVHPGLKDEDFPILDTLAVTGQAYSLAERLVELNPEAGLVERYYDFLYHPMRSEAGSYEAILVFGVDVTDRVEHRRMAEHLQKADKLESLGVLAGGIAHDFNNLLTGILGNLSLAQDMTDTGSPIRKLLANASEASERAAMLTKQMLAYAGKGQFFVQHLDVSAVVRKTMKLVGPSIPFNVHVETALRDDLPSIEADETQLEQVAMNLILNAAEATAERGGKVFVRTGVEEIVSDAPEKHYDVGHPSPGQHVVLEVQDTGAGIESSIRLSIFDPFFTTKFTGRGLGLAALSGIVRVLNGAVLVNSAPGQGSTFRVLIPVALKAEKTHSVQSRAQVEPILVVDDEEIVRKTANLMLRNRGYEVILAEDGQQAVDLFRKLGGRVAVVLLDMAMPVMSGEETFRNLKTIRDDVPVIVCSGYGESEAVRSFGGLGVAGFLQKPFTVEVLAEKIQGVLNR